MKNQTDQDEDLGETIELPLSAPHIGEWVVEVQDDSGMRRIPLPPAGLIFGTSRSADVQLRDPTVSALHCDLMIDAGAVRVRDVGSRNGTYLSGARIKIAYALAGEVVFVGRSSLAIKAARANEVNEAGPPLPGLIGQSLVMRRLADHVRRVAVLNVPVLIVGETGSGKELVARAIHDESTRCKNAFVAVNMTAVPHDLIETEMFGHERGSFTGAYQSHRGAFADAEKGTLFLDEIGDLALDMQPKLLRALDGYEVKSVGQHGSGRKVDVRVVAATNAKLKERVADGRFRQDLFHRLEAIVVHIPPLRARHADIPALAAAFLRTMELPGGPPRLLAEAVSVLSTHDWPGNVRELRHVLFRAALVTDGDSITADAVRSALEQPSGSDVASTRSPDLAKAWLDKCGGNVSRAARESGIPRTTLRRLVASPDEVATERMHR